MRAAALVAAGLAFAGAAAFAASASPPPGAASRCDRARTPVETSICTVPSLKVADAALAKAYLDLRRTASAKAAVGLKASQRNWLASRNARCATGQPACLAGAYAERKRQLDALAASAAATDDRLQDATVVIVDGRWKAARILDPEGGPGAPPDPRMSRTLTFAGLPQPGETVQTRAGEVCLKGAACRAMGWRVARLDEETQRLASALKLPPASPLYVGSDGGRETLQLVPAADGRLLAPFSLCKPGTDDCRNGFEEWVPLGPDARVEVVRPPAS